MKRCGRVLAMILAVALVAGMLGTVALAASSVYKSGIGTVTVVTGKKSWLVLNPQITVKNVGNYSATIHVWDSRGAMVGHMETLKPNKSTTFTLKPSQTYQVSYMGHWTQGGGAQIEVSAKRSIQNIY